MGTTSWFFSASAPPPSPLTRFPTRPSIPPFLTPVTTFTRGAVALKTLRERRHDFDIVLSDVHMPDMDGFKLLEHIALELDVPVMMMSANCATDVVLRGIIHGAVDYLLKPVRIEELRNIWQHVVRKKRGGEGGADGASAGSGEADAASEGSLEGSRGAQNAKTSKGTKANGAGSPGRSNGTGEEPWKKRSRKPGSARDDYGNGGDANARGDGEGKNEEGHEDSSNLKKPRVVWSAELHQQFVTAVNTLGIDKAVPKRILDLMGVQGLTRENVASHLQKYRLYLKRLQGVSNGACWPGGGGSPGFMTGLAVDHSGMVVGGPGGPGGTRVGSPAMHSGPNGGVVMGVGMDGMGGGMHHPQMMAPGAVMYQYSPGPNGMIAIPGVHSGPNGGGGKEGKDGRGGYGVMGVGSMGMMPGGMMPGGMVPGGVHHVHSNGNMHPGGMLMAPVSMGNGGYSTGPGDQNGARGGAGYAYPVRGGVLMPPGGGLDGGDISGKALGSLGGDLGDDAVLDMFLKDGLPEGDGFESPVSTRERE